MLLIKVTLIGENTSGRNSNSIYAFNVFVTKDMQHELPIIFMVIFLTTQLLRQIRATWVLLTHCTV